jgi:hypothetical protein
LGFVRHISIGDLVSAFGDNDNVLIGQTSQPGHGAQYYSQDLNAIIVIPVGDQALAKSISDMNAYSAALNGIEMSNIMGCTTCLAANPAFQDDF